MLNGIPNLNGLAEKISAAKTTLFQSTDISVFETTRNTLQNTPRINEHEAASFWSDQATRNDMATPNVKDFTGAYDDFQETISNRDFKELKLYMPPLLLGFNSQSDFVQLEYCSVPDPKTGLTVKPRVTVAASADGKTGHIYLNGTLAACVDGAADISVLDVKLVEIDG